MRFNLFHTPSQRPTFAGGDGHEMLLKKLASPKRDGHELRALFFPPNGACPLREKRMLKRVDEKRRGLQEKLGVSKYRGTPKWMVYNMEHQIKNG